MTHDPWECTELSEAPNNWIRATENGWGALVLWAAGPYEEPLPGGYLLTAPPSRHKVAVGTR
jgi:hypothetical protein